MVAGRGEESKRVWKLMMKVVFRVKKRRTGNVLHESQCAEETNLEKLDLPFLAGVVATGGKPQYGRWRVPLY